MDEMLHLMPPEIGRLVVGTTPEVSPGNHQRYREILTFLEILSKTPDWRALDDAAFEFHSACQQLILCNGKTGMDDRAVGQIRAWLEN